MKKIAFMFVAAAMFVACGGSKTEAPVEEAQEAVEQVAEEVAEVADSAAQVVEEVADSAAQAVEAAGVE